MAVESESNLASRWRLGMKKSSPELRVPLEGRVTEIT
jgi:hypothetical protein